MLCVGVSLLPAALTGCQSTHYVSGTIEPNGLGVLKSEFIYLKKDQPITRHYIIVQQEKLEFPIYLYRFSENEYSALWMKCSHQGAELQASGDYLQCPSHGSEFNNKGVVSHGPAEQNLRSFKVVAFGEKILIELRHS